MRSLAYVTCTLFCAIFLRFSLCSVVSTGNFSWDFYITWSPDHVTTSPDSHLRTLKLDNSSGSGFGSNQRFLFGQFDMNIKLVPGRSAGTVVAYYLQSDDGPARDEIDFEFLGNVEGQPYAVQTNVFTNGNGYREERLTLWFDPTHDFHTYSIHWNIHQLVLLVDNIPIRVFRNHADEGVEYPNMKPMQLLASIWNGENWATRGGQDKIDWTKAPFIASYNNYELDACISNDTKSCSAASDTNWWNKHKHKTLSEWEKAMYEWVREHFMSYDYCQDTKRFKHLMPKECSLPKY
ncbi:hypothetical protein QQ045_021825 [Rhodiola kirilowii]